MQKYHKYDQNRKIPEIRKNKSLHYGFMQVIALGGKSTFMMSMLIDSSIFEAHRYFLVCKTGHKMFIPSQKIRKQMFVDYVLSHKKSKFHQSQIRREHFFI